MARHWNTGFRCLHVSRIAGQFTGYAPATIHRLEDGSTWRQVYDLTEHVSAESPRAWIYTDGVNCYLDVEGTHGVVRVSQCVDPLARPPATGHSWPR